jgi:hypothetical protein
MYSIYYKMTKAKVKRKSKKEKVVKKTKARQIIKQKVVINLDKSLIRRGRGRPRSNVKNSINKPQSVPTVTQFPIYDMQRASIPYIEEIKEDVKRLEGGQSDAMLRLMDMQKAGYMLQRQIMDRPAYQQKNIELSTESTKRVKTGGRVKGSKNKPKVPVDLGPTIEEKLRSETANIQREMETQTEPPTQEPAPLPPAKGRKGKGNK